MRISISNFSGMLPILDARALPDHAAQIAENCQTESGVVKLRTDVPAWSDPEEEENISAVNKRKYSIQNGILCEDNISLHMPKPAKVTLEKVPFWTLKDGYTHKKDGVEYPSFQLKSTIGIAGTPSTLNPSAITIDEDTSAFTIKFTKIGTYIPSNTQAIINLPDVNNITLLYNSIEIPLAYPSSISIPDDENGVYATLYFEGVTFETETPPGNGSMQIDTVHTIIKGKIVQNKTRRNYVVTYWDGRHESPPSDVSDAIDISNGDKVKITIPSYTPNQNYTPEIADNAPAFYIYRTGGSVTSSNYYFVDEKASYGTYTDEKKDYLLQEALSVVESPRNDMSDLHFFNGSLVAAKDNHVYFSEQHILYHWPSSYEYSFADDVTAITVTGNNVIVFAKGKSPSILQGSHPGAMSQTELEDRYICVSAQSVCTVEGVTYYATAEGLAALSPSGQCRLISKNFFSREQWAALNPETLKCSADSFAIRLYTESGIIYIFDLLQDGMTLSRYNTGSQFIWKTKVLTFPVPVCFRLVRITTADGKGEGTVFAGTDMQNQYLIPCSIPNGRAVNIPVTFSRQWCFQVKSESDLIEIEAASTPIELY